MPQDRGRFTFCFLSYHPLIDLVLQWVPQLKRSGLNEFFIFWLGAVSCFPSTGAD
jgi:hypothetical protein